MLRKRHWLLPPIVARAVSFLLQHVFAPSALLSLVLLLLTMCPLFFSLPRCFRSLRHELLATFRDIYVFLARVVTHHSAQPLLRVKILLMGLTCSLKAQGKIFGLLRRPCSRRSVAARNPSRAKETRHSFLKARSRWSRRLAMIRSRSF